MNCINYKIIKYKIKFLNSIKNSNFDKSKLYLKKYSNYYNQNNFNKTQIQIGGSILEITNNKDLDNLMTNITNLIISIFGKDLGHNVVNEFKTKTNFDKIKYPAEINLDIFIENVFKTAFSDNEFKKQIDVIIGETFKEIEPNKKIIPGIKLKEENIDIKDLLNLIKPEPKPEPKPELKLELKPEPKPEPKPESSNKIKNIFDTPYPTIIYSQNPMIYSQHIQPIQPIQPIINWNSDDLGLNIKISDSVTKSSRSRSRSSSSSSSSSSSRSSSRSSSSLISRSSSISRSRSDLNFNKKKNKKYKKK